MSYVIKMCHQDLKVSSTNWLSDQLCCMDRVLASQELTHSKDESGRYEDAYMDVCAY